MLLEPAILLWTTRLAAIDSETEHEIFEALDRAIEGRTTFIVAHRLSTLRRAGLIIVLENGRIVQQGTHSELIKVPGPYTARGQPAAGRRPGAPGARTGKGAPCSDLDLATAPILVHAPRPGRGRASDEEQFKPLEWGLVRRMVGYSRPVRGKVITMFILTVIRAAQLPALVWVTALVIKGPIAHKDVHGILLGTAGYVALAVVTDFMFHFRQRFALEIGETVVNGMRTDTSSTRRCASR